MKEIIKKYYENFNQRNYQGMLDLLSSDVIHEINQGEAQIGKERFRKFLEIMDKHYREELSNIIILGDGKNFAAEFICHGTYNVTAEGLPAARGQRYNLKVGAFFELEGQKIKRITNYYNLQDWINQVSN